MDTAQTIPITSYIIELSSINKPVYTTCAHHPLHHCQKCRPVSMSILLYQNNSNYCSVYWDLLNVMYFRNWIFPTEMSAENVTQVFECSLCRINTILNGLITLLLLLLLPVDVIRIYFYGFVGRLPFRTLFGLLKRTQLKWNHI